MNEARWLIPGNWAWVTVGEVAKIIGGGTPSSQVPSHFVATGVPWITPADLTGYTNAYISRGRRDLSDIGYSSCNATLVPAGTVLFSSRAPIGYCVIAANEISTNQGFKNLIIKGDIQPEFIRYYLLSSKDYAESKASGTTFLELSSKRVGELAVPIAPLAEQKRIINKIDSLISCTARARNELDRIPRLIQQYKKHLLSKAFNGTLTHDWRIKNKNNESVVGRNASEIRNKFLTGVNKPFSQPYSIPDSWNWLALPELGELDRGKSKHRPRNDPRLFGGNYPFIQTGDVRSADRFLNKHSETYSEFGLAQSRLWPIGTVCITIAANIAETAILGVEACFPDSIAGFIADKERVSPDYIEFFIRTVKDELAAFAPATAQKNINLDVLSSIRVPVPPVCEQNEIVRRLEKIFAWIDHILIDHEAATKLLSRLDATVLSKAFRGELVPQDPNDEPASKLMRCIHEKHSIEQEKTQKKRTRDHSMIKNPRDILLKDSESWPERGLSFEDIVKRNMIPYEEMRDTIFIFLAEKHPKFIQVFDKDAECIYLQRVKL